MSESRTGFNSRPGPKRPRDGEWAVLLRVFVLVPAFVTAIGVGASRLWSEGSQPPAPAGALELAPATVSLHLPGASYGPALGDVYSVIDATRTPTGWAVLDGSAQQIVLLDDSARLVARTGSPGEGPGQLTDAQALARVDSLLVVADMAARRLDVFRLDGEFVTRIPLPAPACAGAPLRDMVGEEETIALLRLCTRVDGSTSALVERFRLTGEREVLLDSVFNDMRSRTLDPLRAPMIARAAGRLWFALAPGRCATALDPEAGAPAALCHPDANPFPVSDSLRASLDEVATQLRAFGTTLVLPERLPPFDALVEVDGALAFHVVLDDDTHALEVARGDRLVRIELPPRAHFLPAGRELLLAQDRLEGTAFAVVRLP